MINSQTLTTFPVGKLELFYQKINIIAQNGNYDVKKIHRGSKNWSEKIFTFIPFAYNNLKIEKKIKNSEETIDKKNLQNKFTKS